MRKGLLLIALTAFAVISCGAKNGNESANAAEEILDICFLLELILS